MTAHLLRKLRPSASIVACLGLALLGASAMATPTTQSFSSAFDLSNNASLGAEQSPRSTTIAASQNVSVQGFDGSLGNLTGVSVSFTANWDHTTSVSGYADDSYGDSWWGVSYNFADIAASGGAGASYSIGLVGQPGSLRSLSTANSGGCSGSGYYTINCTDSRADNGTFTGTLNLSGIALSSFIATPTDPNLFFAIGNEQTATVSACTLGDWDPSQYCTAWGGGRISGQLAVNYSYDNQVVALGQAPNNATPEPATLMLVVLGGALFGMARRRKTPSPLRGV